MDQNQNKILLKKLHDKKFKEVDYYLAELPDEELRERLYYILSDVLDEEVDVDQDALRNLLHFYQKVILEMVE